MGGRGELSCIRFSLSADKLANICVSLFTVLQNIGNYQNEYKNGEEHVFRRAKNWDPGSRGTLIILTKLRNI